MCVLYLNNGNVECISNEEDFARMLQEYLGDDAVEEFRSYLIDYDEMDEIRETNSELEAENHALKEVNNKLENTIEMLSSGDSLNTNTLSEINFTIIRLASKIKELEKVSKAKKVLDLKNDIMEELQDLNNFIKEIR